MFLLRQHVLVGRRNGDGPLRHVGAGGPAPAQGRARAVHHAGPQIRLGVGQAGECAAMTAEQGRERILDDVLRGGKVVHEGCGCREECGVAHAAHRHTPRCAACGREGENPYTPEPPGRATQDLAGRLSE
ncbi:hypothetical protein Shyhy02_42340 [Streptomyces hygroscopicus subsp. hygroscopicus]|nr:hypothetical protein Shyhy02_42340 [Streptomyces hygroscopicus subsp. hygroscopicus]